MFCTLYSIINIILINYIINIYIYVTLKCFLIYIYYYICYIYRSSSRISDIFSFRGSFSATSGSNVSIYNIAAEGDDVTLCGILNQEHFDKSQLEILTEVCITLYIYICIYMSVSSYFSSRGW